MFAAVATGGVLGLWQLTRDPHPRRQDFGADYYWPLWFALLWALLVLLHYLYAAGRLSLPSWPPTAGPAPAGEQPAAAVPARPHQPDHRALDQLTAREREVLALVADGCANKEIARRLSISERTARTHVSNILRKLELSSRTQAALVAVHTGLTAPAP
jgi:DNA-binding CsgD family transcriptional regulator